MSDRPVARLETLAEIRASNVDKKTMAGEQVVLLCNYMDVYGHRYISCALDFMRATASPAEVQRFAVSCGDVMLTKDSETPDDIGIPAVVVDDVPDLICGYHLALLKPNRSRVDPVYLTHQIASVAVARYFGRVASGSTRYGLTHRAIAQAPIPLPPLAQQRRIAEILLSVDEAIESTEALLAKTQQVNAGLMHDVFTRGVTPDGRLRPPREEAPTLYKESPLGWIPKEWEPGKLADKRGPGRPHLKTGPFGSSLKIEHWVEDGRPVITIGSLGEGEFIASELLYVSEHTAARLRDYQLQVGDVVFSRVADVGRSAVINDDQRGWIMSSNLMRISLDRDRVVPAFLQAQLAQDGRVRRQIRATVNAGGRDVANSQVLNRLHFSWPAMDEQERIVDRFQGLWEERRVNLASLGKVRFLRAGLAHALLTDRDPALQHRLRGIADDV